MGSSCQRYTKSVIQKKCPEYSWQIKACSKERGDVFNNSCVEDKYEPSKERLQTTAVTPEVRRKVSRPQ